MSAPSVKEAKVVASKEQHVLIIGRPEIFVDGIVGILEAGNPDYRVTCVAPGAPCMRYFVGDGPDYLLIQDTAKPEPFEDFVTEMVEGFPGLRLLVFGQKMSDDFLYRILSAGAHGYFNERMSGDIFFRPSPLSVRESTGQNATSWRNLLPIAQSVKVSMHVPANWELVSQAVRQRCWNLFCGVCRPVRLLKTSFCRTRV